MWIGRNGSCSCNAAQRNAGEASGWTTVGGRAGSAPKAGLGDQFGGGQTVAAGGFRGAEPGSDLSPGVEPVGGPGTCTYWAGDLSSGGATGSRAVG